ncbi:MAG: carbohydrate ABC transporter permease [Eisenbergiella massiliensis]
MKKRKWIYLSLTIPALALMILFIAAPLVNAVRISFFKWNGYSQNMRWYGLKNFVNLFTDNLFWRATLNTMIYGFGSTFFQNVCGLAAALFLNNKFKGRNGVRVILYMPIMISAFIMGQILYYFVQAEGGVFNELLGIIGISPIYWMKTGLSSTLMIMLANSWQYMGLCMIIYLAGLQNIPSMYKEAARLDGAGKMKEFIYVTLPLLIPSITTAVVTNLIGGFKLFDASVAMSNGGPNRKSMSLSFYISQLYFNDEKAGYASAVGIMTFFIIMIIALPVNAYLRKKEVEY